MRKKIRIAALLLLLAAFALTSCAQSAHAQTPDRLSAQKKEQFDPTPDKTTGSADKAQEEAPALPAETTRAASPVSPAAEPEPKKDAQTIAAPTTAAPTTTTAPTTAGPADYAFTVDSFRTGVCFDARSFPNGTVIDSVDALEAYAQANDEAFGFVRRRAASDTPQDFDRLAAKYDDAWFASHRLLILEIEAGSGSFVHTIRGVSRTASGTVNVEYTRTKPEIFTCDMAYWFFFVELDTTDLRSGDPVAVTLIEQ